MKGLLFKLVDLFALCRLMFSEYVRWHNAQQMLDRKSADGLLEDVHLSELFSTLGGGLPQKWQIYSC